jgi:AcrR family transcriptional regulator
MTKRSIDRRVARTRKTLHHALISLILEKDYDAITIEEICDAANVGRSTFYAHYTSKDDLHQSGIENLRRVLAERRTVALASAVDVRGQSLSFIRTLFEHAYDHKHLFCALAGRRGGTVALAAIRRIISDAVREELAMTGNNSSADTIPREFIVQYIVGACMAVLTWWLDNGTKIPADRIDAMFRRLAIEGVMGPIADPSD